MNLVFAGLDGEMSGTDWQRHELIQIGLALDIDDVFDARIGWSAAAYEQEALDSIGLSVADTREGAAAAAVDAQLEEWLQARRIAEHSIVPIGWAVSDFDRPFIAKTLPRFTRYLHHHSVELNALIYLLDRNVRYLDHEADFATWKKMSKRMAELTILHRRGTSPRPHHAADDAVAALISYRWLRAIVAEKRSA